MKCAVLSCRNNTLKRIDGISFHRFPKDERRRNLWRESIGRPDLIIKAGTCVCSDHFTEKDLETGLSKARITHNALPVLKLNLPSWLARPKSSLNEEMSQELLDIATSGVSVINVPPDEPKDPPSDVSEINMLPDEAEDAPSNITEINMPPDEPKTAPYNISEINLPPDDPKPVLRNITKSRVVLETGKENNNLYCTKDNPKTTMEPNQLCSEDGMDINREQFKLICRMCLKCKDLVNIFSESVKNSGLWKMIDVHLGQDVSKDKDMPEYICLLCIKTICDFDMYCIQAAKNQDDLRKIFNTKMKPTNKNTRIEIYDDGSQSALDDIVRCPSPFFELNKEADLEEDNEMQTNNANSQSIIPEPLLNMAPICYVDEVIFPMDDIGVDMDYIAENLELEKLPDSSEKDFNESTDDDDESRVETVVSAGDNINEIFHNYCSTETEPFDVNSNIPEHMKPLMKNYPKILMKDGRVVVRSWRLHEMLKKFYILKCDICSEGRASKHQYKHIKGLFMHYQKCHGTEGYIMCCDKPLRDRTELTYHMIWHVQPSAFRCSICGKKVSKPTALVAHMKSHKGKEMHGGKEIRCDECGIRLKTEHFLEIHKLKLHHNNENELLEGDINEPHPNFPGFPKSIMKNGEVALSRDRLSELVKKFYTFTCDMCNEDKTFPDFKALLEHYQNVHSTKGYAMCCGSKLKNRTKLTYHMARHLDPDAFKCRYCGKVIEKLGKLKDHMMVHKSEEERVYFCTKCPRRYVTQAGLLKHMISHTPKDQRKKHPCRICGKKFDYPSSLESHLRTNHNNQEYICHVCGKVFKNIYLFKAHAKRHDPNFVPYKCKANYRSPKLRKRRSRSTSIICPYCSIEFSTKKGIIEHVEQEHDCVHKCPHCHYSNTKYVLYLRHMAEKHLLDRKYVCKICGAQFEYGCKLKYHMNGHTKEKIYPCQFCGKEYISLSGLCRHGREFHGEEYRQLKDRKVKMRKLKNESVEEDFEENTIIVDVVDHLDFSMFLVTDE